MPVKNSILQKTKNLPFVKKDNQPFIITIKHVTTIEGCSDSTASRRIKIAHAALGKKQHQKITVQEYADYYGFDYSLILQKI